MRTLEARQYEMLVRVQHFGKDHVDLFPESTIAAQEFAAVGAAVKQLEAHAVSKKSTMKDGVRIRAIARHELQERLELIHRTARAIAADTPGLEDKFGIPASRSDASLLTAARQFVQDGADVKSHFFTHGMPRTFLADLEELIESFEAAIQESTDGKSDTAQARANIAAAVETGIAAARKLDVLVANRLRKDPGIMAKWQKERRIDRRRRGRRPVATVAVPSPVSVSPAPAAPPAVPADQPAVPATPAGVGS